METVTKKRGRPRLYDGEGARIVGELFAQGKTERTKQNAVNMQLAFGALRTAANPDYYWIADTSQETNVFKYTVLSELGRWSYLGEDEAILHAARIISDMQPRPTAHQAVSVLRKLRIGVSLVGDADKLATELLATIDDYVGRFPQTSEDTVVEAIEQAGRLVAVIQAFRADRTGVEK